MIRGHFDNASGTDIDGRKRIADETLVIWGGEFHEPITASG